MGRMCGECFFIYADNILKGVGWAVFVLINVFKKMRNK